MQAASSDEHLSCQRPKYVSRTKLGLFHVALHSESEVGRGNLQRVQIPHYLKFSGGLQVKINVLEFEIGIGIEYCMKKMSLSVHFRTLGGLMADMVLELM